MSEEPKEVQVPFTVIERAEVAPTFVTEVETIDKVQELITKTSGRRFDLYWSWMRREDGKFECRAQLNPVPVEMEVVKPEVTDNGK